MKDNNKKIKKYVKKSKKVIQKGGNKPFVAQFIIQNSYIAKFRRWVKKPKDCVINAMQLLNILDEQSADIARIFIGDTGVQKEQIEQVFSLIQQLHEWKFLQVNSLNDIREITNNILKPSHAFFCGYVEKNEGHVFLIAKDDSNKVFYIDPQVNEVCDLNKCSNYILNKDGYFILHAKLK